MVEDSGVPVDMCGPVMSAASQTWEYEAFLGPISARDEILEVVGGLRLP